MKKVYVASVQPDPEGPVFGRVIDPNDMQKLQDFAHAHVTQIVKDLLVAGAASAQVAGFVTTSAGGMNLSVATGSVVDQNGVSYDGPEEATVVAIQAADVALPRKDLVYASLAIDTPAASEFKPFRQLRTQAELEAGADPYVPIQYDQPTELQTRATIGVKLGVPNAVPVAPVAGANEVPLYEVAVAAGAVALNNGNLTSVRTLMKSLYQAFVDIATVAATIANMSETIDDRVATLIIDSASITKVYNDGLNTLQLNVANEAIDDRVDALLAVTAPIAKAYNDGANTLTLSLTYTPVNKAGDSMTGKLAITQSTNFLDVLELIGQNASKGISLDLANAGVLLALKVNGTDSVKFDASGAGGALGYFSKSLNDDYLMKFLNPGARGWGVHVVVGSSGTLGEPTVTLESAAGVIFNLIANGKLALGHGTPDLSGTGKVHMAGDSFRLQDARSPASNATGKAGEFCWDANYIYICTATNTWKRVALTGGY
ncbi:MAG TPA: hypothetical protein VJU84_08490 [Pyrinomonadaceae bacterium]|nr:hypothetical protein [Pyrinomonadaceae bacterium]